MTTGDQLAEACWQEEGELDSDNVSLGTQESSDVDECGEEDADRVSEETLKKLESSEPLQNMLCNPHLRQLLLDLDQCTSPAKMLQQAMELPIFIEFSEECLQVCGLRDTVDTETHENHTTIT